MRAGIFVTGALELISAVAPTVYWDRRDDPVEPRRGYFARASMQYAFPLFAARTHFLKETVQATWYLPLSERLVFAVSSRAGSIQGIRSTGTADCATNGSCVPLSERFTGGGASSHRAYPLDLLGDLCADGQPDCSPTLISKDGAILPVGGMSIFVTNVELRFPIVSNVGGAFFADAGNVSSERVVPFGALRYGAGAGVRYLSPVGPLRFDIGYNLHRRPYEKRFAYFVSLGHAF